MRLRFQVVWRVCLLVSACLLWAGCNDTKAGWADAYWNFKQGDISLWGYIVEPETDNFKYIKQNMEYACTSCNRDNFAVFLEHFMAGGVFQGAHIKYSLAMVHTTTDLDENVETPLVTFWAPAIPEKLNIIPNRTQLQGDDLFISPEPDGDGMCVYVASNTGTAISLAYYFVFTGDCWCLVKIVDFQRSVMPT